MSSNVELYQQTMKAVLIDSGIQESWIMAVEDPEKLKSIFEGPYQAYCDVRELRDEAQWEYYTLTGITGLREQILLDEARKNLRRAWQTAFAKKKQPSKGDSESKCSGGETGCSN